METKGLMLDLRALKREMKERKSTRARLNEPMQRVLSPKTDRTFKRSVSPVVLELQRMSVQQRVSSPVSNMRRTPTSPSKKLALNALSIPSTRSELVNQYPRHNPLLKVPDVSFPSKSNLRISSYKKDAAALLTNRLKKHFYQFFYVWKRHAKELKSLLLRYGNSPRLLISISGTRNVTLSSPKRIPHSTKAYYPEKVGFRGNKETGIEWSQQTYEKGLDHMKSEDFYQTRSNLTSPMSDEHLFPSKSPDLRLPKSPSQTGLAGFLLERESLLQKKPSELSQGISLDLYSDMMQDDHMAMVSTISRPGTETSHIPDDSGTIIKLIFTLAMLLKRKKQAGFSALKAGTLRIEAARTIHSFLYQRIMIRYQDFLYSLVFQTSKTKQKPTFSIVKAINKLAIRPFWEKMKMETVKEMMKQLFSIGIQKLEDLRLSLLRLSYIKLKENPRKPQEFRLRKPAISLKSRISIVFRGHLQEVFNEIKRFGGSHQQRRSELKSKLRFVLQVFELHRFKLLSKEFNLLKQSKTEISPEAKSIQNWNRTGTHSIGGKIVARVLNQVLDRDMREWMKTVATYSVAQSTLQKRIQAVVSLSSLLQTLVSKSLFHFLIVFKSLRPKTSASRVVKHMFRIFLTDQLFRIKTGFTVWKNNAKAKKTDSGTVNKSGFIHLAEIIQEKLMENAMEAFERISKGFPIAKKEGKIESGQKNAVFGLVSLLKRLVSGRFRLVKSGLGNSLIVEKIRKIAVKSIGNWTRRRVFSTVKAAVNVWQGLMKHKKGKNWAKAFIGISKVHSKRVIRAWLHAVTSKRNLERGLELLFICLRNKVKTFLFALQIDSNSGFFSSEMENKEEFNPAKGLGLRFAIECIKTNHLVVKQAAFQLWENLGIRQDSRLGNRKVLMGIVELMEMMKIKAILRENAAFQKMRRLL